MWRSLAGRRLSIAALGTFGAGGWFETAVLADHRFWIGPDLRLDAGLGFALAVTKDVRDEDDAEDVEIWVRPHARFELDVRALPHAWLGLQFEPGITVDQLTERLDGNIKTISQHTHSLVRAGLLNKAYKGRMVAHELSPYGKRFASFIKSF